MNVRIGVDMDGVLARFDDAFSDKLIETSGRDLFPNRPYDPPCWNWDVDLGYTKEETTAAWEAVKNDATFWEQLPAYPETDSAIEYLRGRRDWCGDDVYFITNRMGINPKVQTEHWLVRHGFNRPTVLISEAKKLCAQALKLTVYIDDKWENARDVALTTTTTFLMDRPWNQGYNAEQIGIARTNTVVGLVEAAPVVTTPVPASH